MSSKNKKAKKKNDKITVTVEEHACGLAIQPTLCKINYNTYFNDEEIQEIICTLKINDIDEVPLIIGATIVNKLDVVKIAVNMGFPINETDAFNNTALMWGVKSNFLEIVEFILYEGGDVRITNVNSENALTLALKHKLWDEQSFINLWFILKNNDMLEMEFVRETGPNLLHLSVRREWDHFLNILLNEQLDVDSENDQGVTPLMLACFRNNWNLVNLLLNAGACVLKEDHQGSMAVCYAISAALNSPKPPYKIVDKMMNEMKKVLPFREYLKRRLEILNVLAEQTEEYHTDCNILIKVIQYAVQQTPNGLKILLDLNIFQHIQKAIKKSDGDNDKIKFFLMLAMELLFFNEQSECFNSDVQVLLLGKFFNNILPNTCLDRLRSREDKDVSTISFFVLMLSCTCNEFGQRWLKEKYEFILPFYESNFKEQFNFIQHDFGDEKRLKIMKKKLKKIKRMINTIENNKSNLSRDLSSKEDRFCNKGEKKNDAFISCSKKTRRRSRALKMKMTKMKNAELAQRLSLNTKKMVDQKSDDLLEELYVEEEVEETTPILGEISDTSWSVIEGENPITSSLIQYLENSEVKHFLEENDRKSSNGTKNSEWRSQIMNLRYENSKSLLNSLRFDKKKLTSAFQNLRDVAHGCKQSLKIMNSLNVITEYLTQLLQIIIERYQEHSENDTKSNQDFYEDYLISHTKEDSEDPHKPSERMEKHCFEDLHKKFDHLILSIRNLYIKNPLQCYNNVCKLEKTLLSFKINGKPLYDDLAHTEKIKIRYSLPENDILDEASFIDKYIEDVLNDKIGVRDDISIKVSQEPSHKHTRYEEAPIEIFNRELGEIGMNKPVYNQKAFEDKQRTLDNAYHLIDSIMGTCESDDEKKGTNKKDQVYTRIWYSKTKQNKSNGLFGGGYPDLFYLRPLFAWNQPCEQLRGMAQPGCEVSSGIGNQISGTVVGSYIDISSLKIKEGLKSAVEESLKLDYNMNTLRSLIELSNLNVLPYYAFYSMNMDTIFSRYVYEMSLSEYIRMMEEKHISLDFIVVAFICQLLTWLNHLHLHGTSGIYTTFKYFDIFVDAHGVMKVRELGSRKALLKMTDISLTWLSQEINTPTEEHDKLECNIASDLHIAGTLWLIHILTEGKYSSTDARRILRNIDKVFDNLEAYNFDLESIINWMDQNSIEKSQNSWKCTLNCACINHLKDFFETSQT